MAKRCFLAPCLCFFLLVLPLNAEPGTLPGDEQVAEQYLLWAEAALAVGRRAEALSALERGADFSSESSDINYLLARLRFEEGKPVGAVLETLHRALEAARWNRYTPEAARLLEAELLIRLRFYEDALKTLAGLPRSAHELRLRLQAARFLSDPAEFRRLMAEALDRYPRESWPLRALFGYGANRLPGGNEADLAALALRQLSLLVEADPELAWMALPFITDLEDAQRLLAAYRAAGRRNLAALPALLNLGLISEDEAVRELFQSASGEEIRLDKALILEIGNLLLLDTAKELFRRNFLTFSGVITEDTDGDGYPEAAVRYRDGLITEYRFDMDQDGLPELTVFFGAGVPFRAEVVVLPELSGTGWASPFAYPVKDGDREKATVRWEQYPAVLESALGWVRYIPRPRDFFYAPFQLQDLGGTGLLFPGGDPWRIRLSQQTLLSFAMVVERPSGEFSGALERIELDRGIPERSREYLEGRIVSETEFFQGRPVIQRIDLDLDGRMETIRRFRSTSPAADGGIDVLFDYSRAIESSESDWDGDGIYETGEQYILDDDGKTGDSLIIRSWDLNRDGQRETEIRIRDRTGN